MEHNTYCRLNVLVKGKRIPKIQIQSVWNSHCLEVVVLKLFIWTFSSHKWLEAISRHLLQWQLVQPAGQPHTSSCLWLVVAISRGSLERYHRSIRPNNWLHIITSFRSVWVKYIARHKPKYHNTLFWHKTHYSDFEHLSWFQTPSFRKGISYFILNLHTFNLTKIYTL